MCPLPAAPGRGHSGQSGIRAQDQGLLAGGILFLGRAECPISCSAGLMLSFTRVRSAGSVGLCLSLSATRWYRQRWFPLTCSAKPNLIFRLRSFCPHKVCTFITKKHRARLLVRAACCWVRGIQTNRDK